MQLCNSGENARYLAARLGLRLGLGLELEREAGGKKPE